MKTEVGVTEAPLQQPHQSPALQSVGAAQCDDRGQTTAERVVTDTQFRTPTGLLQHLGAQFTFLHKTLPKAQLCTQRPSLKLYFWSNIHEGSALHKTWEILVCCFRRIGQMKSPSYTTETHFLPEEAVGHFPPWQHPPQPPSGKMQAWFQQYLKQSFT